MFTKNLTLGLQCFLYVYRKFGEYFHTQKCWWESAYWVQPVLENKQLSV